MRLADGVDAAAFPLRAGVSAGAADTSGVGDRAGDGDGSAADGAGVTRTSGVGVSATRATPKPMAAPIPTTSPMTTAMKVRIGRERTARVPAPRGRLLGGQAGGCAALRRAGRDLCRPAPGTKPPDGLARSRW